MLISTLQPDHGSSIHLQTFHHNRMMIGKHGISLLQLLVAILALPNQKSALPIQKRPNQREQLANRSNRSPKKRLENRQCCPCLPKGFRHDHK